MKAKVIIPIVIVIAIGLGIALFASRNRVSDQEVDIINLSNQVNAVSAQVNDLTKVNETLESDLEKRGAEVISLTNAYSQALSTLAKTESDLKETEDTLKTTQEELAARDAKIVALETQNAELDTKSAELNSAITNLTLKIEDTQARLAATEGDKAFLQGELNRLMAEKADLEKKLNDLKFLKAQVAHLKEELSIARRLEWIRKGLFNPADMKGATLLIQKTPPPKPAEEKNKYDLNVEIGADGSVKVIPPPTNAPAGNP